MLVTILVKQYAGKQRWFREDVPAMWKASAAHPGIVGWSRAEHIDRDLAIALVKDKVERLFHEEGWWTVNYQYEIYVSHKTN